MRADDQAAPLVLAAGKVMKPNYLHFRQRTQTLDLASVAANDSVVDV